MDWQQRMESALNLIEEHLTDEIDVERVAREANCSPFHFMRMFDVVTGVGPAEYIRRRRLSQAAIDLASGDDRIIDIALRYGYDSPDSFTRAFKREYGCSPSEARKQGTRLHAYPRLYFSISLKGDKAMEYRIEQGNPMRLIGMTIRANNQDGSNFVDVPAFWDRACADGSFEKLCKKAAGSKLGVIGVCHSFDMQKGTFSYSIAIETPADLSGLPEGCEAIEIPASTWAKFTSRGPLRPNFQDTIKRIFSEWFPASGREHAGTAEIEYYSPTPDANDPDYWCEYWVPLK
jgi:AraC family transcriptional regulator